MLIIEDFTKYEAASGQQISLDKSSILFSKNLLDEMKQIVCIDLGAIKQVSREKYLNLPMLVSISKNQMFGFVK